MLVTTNRLIERVPEFIATQLVSEEEITVEKRLYKITTL